MSRRALMLGVWLASLPAYAEWGAYPEARVKAQFFERFIRFIEWPADAPPPARDPFVLCTVVRDAVAQQLEALARAQTLKDRTVELVHLSDLSAVERCHAVWISSSAGAAVSDVLAHTAGKPILTVGDGEGFADRGVQINLRRSKDRLSFEINLGAAKRSGLRFSSQLVRLASVVREAPP